jgi:hypothetical protein
MARIRKVKIVNFRSIKKDVVAALDEASSCMIRYGKSRMMAPQVEPVDLSAAHSEVTWVNLDRTGDRVRQLRAVQTRAPTPNDAVLITGDSRSPPSQRLFASQIPGAVTAVSARASSCRICFAPELAAACLRLSCRPEPAGLARPHPLHNRSMAARARGASAVLERRGHTHRPTAQRCSALALFAKTSQPAFASNAAPRHVPGQE